MEISKITERFDLVAQKYDEQRRFFIPCFDDFYETSTSFIAEVKNDFKSILDLGAGTGLLTKHLENRFPEADFTLVDISEQMLELARKRFEGKTNFKFLVSNYSNQLPNSNFDLICSALSIHHIENDRKQEFYSMVYNNLQPGGYFINFDLFNATSEWMEQHYVKWWYQFINRNIDNAQEREQYLKRRELDKEDTIEATIQKLRAVGFKHVECIYRFMKFGVVVAVK